MKRIVLCNLYGIKDGEKAYMVKVGTGCFEFVNDKSFASEYTDEEVEEILKGKSYYLKMYNAETMETEEI